MRQYQNPRPAIFFFFLLIVAQAAAQPSEVVWVGADPVECDQSDLSTAIAAAMDFAEIRIANDQAYTGISIQIVGKNLTVIGGYESCGSAEPTGMTQLQGTANQAGYVIAFIGSGESFELQNLEIRAGDNDSSGGGGLLLNGAMLTVLRSVDILGHHSSNGAGVLINGVQGAIGEPAPTQIHMLEVNIGPLVNVALMRNEASGNGGGLSCQHAHVYLMGVSISNNRAGGDGGGVHLDHCRLRLPTVGLHNQVRANHAQGNGGGGRLIASVIESALVKGDFHYSFLTIAENQAGLDGGGIHASSESQFMLVHSPVELNTAGGRGGGLYLDGESIATLSSGKGLLTRTAGSGGDERTHTPIGLGCTQPGSLCSALRSNEADFDGGATIRGGSLLLIDKAWVTGNVAGQNFSVARVEGMNSRLRIWDSLVSGNQSQNRSIGATLDGSAEIYGSTVSGNQFAGSGSSLLIVDAEMDVRNSIIWEPSVIAIDVVGTGTLAVNCTNAHEDSASALLETHDPGFRDPGSSDYRLAAGSMNIDRCQSPQGLGLEFDLLGNERPINLTGVADDQAYDRGAFELRDDVFQDRFEE